MSYLQASRKKIGASLYKKLRSDHAYQQWIMALNELHKLVERKRGSYWKMKIDAQRSPGDVWRVINEGMCRKADQPLSSNSTVGLTAEAFAEFFDRKLTDVRNATEGAAPAEFHDIQSDDRFQGYAPVSVDDVCIMVGKAADK